MDRSSASWIFLLLFIANALAIDIKLDCSDAGCLQDFYDKLPNVEIKKYKEDLRKTFSSSNMHLYKNQMMDAFIRPFSDEESEVDTHLPKACRSSNLRNYRNFVDQRKFTKKSESSESKADCCLRCQTIGDCFSFEYDSSKSQCNVYISQEYLATARKTKACPSGIGEGYLELPNYPIWPGHHGHEPGPCLSSALSKGAKTGHGIDMQGTGEDPDEQILALPKDEDLMEEEEDMIFELR